MNLLMLALLREAGIPAQPVLISTRTNGKPMPLYPFINQFDHVIVQVELGEKQILVDLASSFLPMGFPATNSLNGHGWLVSKDNPQWIDIPSPAASNTYLMNFSLDGDGSLFGNLTMSCDGYSAVDLRQEIHDRHDGQYLKEWLSETLPAITIDSVRFENQTHLSKPFKATATSPPRGKRFDG